MQFRDLKTQYQKLKLQIDTEISDVLAEGNFISGNQIAEMENKLIKYV